MFVYVDLKLGVLLTLKLHMKDQYWLHRAEFKVIKKRGWRTLPSIVRMSKKPNSLDM